jgi:hypothetical protein
MATTDKTILSHIPKQKQALSAKDEDWRKDTVDAFIEMSTFSRNLSHKHDIKKLYDYYNGHQDRNDYNHVLRPYGGRERKNIPADLKRYNIIKPVIDVLLGEKARRPNNAMVTAVNADTYTEKEQAQQAALIEAMLDKYYQRLQEVTGLDAGQQPDEASIEEKMEFFQRNYKDVRSELGQHAWNFIKQYCEIYNKNQKLFKDFLVAGEEYCYNGTNGKDPEHRVINPLDIDYDKDPDLEFVEDGDWCVVRRMMSASSIVTEWHDALKPDDIDYLESPQYNRESFLTFGLDTLDEDERDNDRLLEVFEVYWQSWQKIGFLTYIDEMTGVPEMDVVTEAYKPGPDEDVEWLWIPEVWEGVRIDKDIYVDIKPCKEQRRSMDNPAKNKLPINGRKYSNRNSANISLVMMGIPYQLLYDIYHYRLELSIAKSKDVIAEFDISNIPADWDIDKFMFFVEATGIAWMDYNQDGKKVNPHAKRALDLSVKTIEQYIALLDSVKLEWEHASGVPRQRQGNIDSYDGKGVTEQSIIQSSYITEDYFRKHAQFEERNAKAMIDLSQSTWVEGKKGSYLMPDGTKEFFSIDGNQYSNTEYGVFFSSARKDIENMDMMKQLSQAYVQNGGMFSTVASMLESDNFSEIKRKVEAAEKMQAEREEAIAQAQQEAAQAELEMEQMKMQSDEQQSIRDAQTTIEKALIDADTKKEIEMMKIRAEQDKQATESSLETRKLSEEERANRAQEALKRIELQVKKTQSNGTKK